MCFLGAGLSAHRPSTIHQIGCMDMETHAKFIERAQAHEDALGRINDMEHKVKSTLEEFMK